MMQIKIYLFVIKCTNLSAVIQLFGQSDIIYQLTLTTKINSIENKQPTAATAILQVRINSCIVHFCYE